MPDWRIAPPTCSNVWPGQCRARSGEERAARRAETLRQRHGDKVERRGELGLLAACRDRGVPKPRAVEERRNPVLARCRAHAIDDGLRDDDAARAVVRVLDLDEGRRRVDPWPRGFSAA
jgi:hypothetical protein